MNETDIREQLAAHLAGELDEPAASALQARIESEPWIGRLADEMAEMLVVLGRVDQVAPPPGYADRLRAGLETEIGHPLANPGPGHRVLASSGAAAATGWADAAGPKRRSDAGRPGSGRAQRRRDRLRGVLAVAAVVAVLAVVGVGVLAGGGMFGGGDADDSAFSDQDTAELTMEAADATDAAAAQDDSAREDAAVMADDDAADAGPAEGEAETSAGAGADAAPAPAATEEAAEEEAADAPAEDDVAEEDVAEEALATTTPASPGSADGPAVLDLGAVADDDGAIGRAVGDHPAVDAVLGTPAAEAAERASLYRDELLRGEGFADGTDPAACLADAAGPDLVPAVAARIDLPSGPAVAYALVRSAGGDVLDTVDVWVLDLPGCAVDRVVQAVR